MSSLQSVPDDEEPICASAEGTEPSAAEIYINSVIGLFPSLLPPHDDHGYDSHAPRTTLINSHPPSATEVSRATKAFVAGRLRAYVMPDDIADMIRLKPGDTTQLPRLDVWLQLMGENDVVSHSGTMKGVTGSLFIPDAGDQTKSNARAELKIRLASGPALNSDFGTIYVDPGFDTMHGWAEGGREGGLMSYWAGKVVLSPDTSVAEISALARPTESPGLQAAGKDPTNSRKSAITGI